MPEVPFATSVDEEPTASVSNPATSSRADAELPERDGRGTLARVVAGVEERFLVPCYSSPRRAAWIAAYGALALPLLTRGRERFCVARMDGEPVRVAAIGRASRIQSLLAHWLEDPLPRLEAGAIHSLWIPSDCMRHAADLRVAEIHAWAAPRFRRAGWHIVPDSVRWTAHLDTIPPPLLRKSLRRSLRSDVARVRSGGFAIEEADAAADWEEFFSTMVQPTAIRRFGAEAWLPSPRLMRTFARAGTLLFLHSAGVRVAGICVIRTGTSLWAPVSGVRGGLNAPRREGVGAALYALPLEWARARGIKMVDMGRTSPRVADPIAWYKRKWGFLPTMDPLAHRLAISVDPHCLALQRALARNPVLVEQSDGLAEFAGAT